MNRDSGVRARDEALLHRIKQRDETALEALYQQYGALVYSLAVRVVGSTILAEEVTQDTFLQVWQRPDQWDPGKGRFSSWLLTVTRFTAIDCLRGELRRTARDVSPKDWLEWFDRDPNQHDLRQDGQTLRRLLDQLPAEQSWAIQLAFFQGLTHSQIADMAHLPLGTIKTRIRLGLQKLKQLWMSSDD